MLKNGMRVVGRPVKEKWRRNGALGTLDTMGWRAFQSIPYEWRNKLLIDARAQIIQTNQNKIARLSERPVQSLPRQSLNLRQQKWEKTLEDYLSFIKEYLRPPSYKASDANEKRLRNWRRDQLGKYKKGKLSQNQIAKLNEASFFNLQTNQQKWEKTLEDYIAFVRTHQRLPSKDSNDAKEKHLHSWRWIQAAKLKEGKLSENQIAKLNEALFFNLLDSCKIHAVLVNRSWKKNLDAWIAFKKENAREPSQVAKDPDEKRLGRWCNARRIRFNHGMLSPEKATKFKDAEFDFGEGGMWNKKWEKKFADYLDFREKHKRGPSKLSKDKYEKSLARWHRTQHGLYIYEKLLPERQAKMENAGILEPLANKSDSEKRTEQ